MFDNFRGETGIIRKKNIPMALLECLTLITGPVALFFSVLTYVLTGEQVTPAKTFMLLSFLSILRTSLLTWSTSGISMLLEAIVSLNRIERFLLLENLPFIENEQDRRITDVDYKSRKSTDSSSLIFVRNCLQQSSENLLPPKEGKRTLVVSGLTCKLTDPIKKTVLEKVSFEARTGPSLLSLVTWVVANPRCSPQLLVRLNYLKGK